MPRFLEEVNGTGTFGPGGDYESVAARSVAIAVPLALLTCFCVLIAGWWNSPNRMAVNQLLLHTAANEASSLPVALRSSMDSSGRKTPSVSIIKGPTCRVEHGAEAGFPQELTVAVPDSKR